MSSVFLQSISLDSEAPPYILRASQDAKRVVMLLHVQTKSICKKNVWNSQLYFEGLAILVVCKSRTHFSIGIAWLISISDWQQQGLHANCRQLFHGRHAGGRDALHTLLECHFVTQLAKLSDKPSSWAYLLLYTADKDFESYGLPGLGLMTPCSRRSITSLVNFPNSSFLIVERNMLSQNPVTFTPLKRRSLSWILSIVIFPPIAPYTRTDPPGLMQDAKAPTKTLQFSLCKKVQYCYLIITIWEIVYWTTLP